MLSILTNIGTRGAKVASSFPLFGEHPAENNGGSGQLLRYSYHRHRVVGVFLEKKEEWSLFSSRGISIH